METQGEDGLRGNQRCQHPDLDFQPPELEGDKTCCYAPQAVGHRFLLDKPLGSQHPLEDGAGACPSTTSSAVEIPQRSPGAACGFLQAPAEFLTLWAAHALDKVTAWGWVRILDPGDITASGMSFMGTVHYWPDYSTVLCSQMFSPDLPSFS